MKKAIEEKKEEKQTKERGELKEAFVLWKHTSKANDDYLTGYTSDEEHSIKLLGFFNTNKENPKQPDILIYETDSEGKRSEKTVASLWENVSKNDNRYLTGTTNENEKIIAFYGKENEEKRPYLRVYYQED